MTETKHTLRAARRARGMKQTELSVRANVSLGVISRIENGHSARPDTWVKLATALGLTMADIDWPLLTGGTTAHPEPQPREATTARTQHTGAHSSHGAFLLGGGGSQVIEY